MTAEIWFTYIATVIALMITPGPSQLLMLSNSAKEGFQRATATAAGDLSANALQMLAAGLGIAALVATSAHALTIIKWLGVAYLVWLGAQKIWKARPGANLALEEGPQTPLWSLYMQGFVTSAANPKAVVFFAALFPLFIDNNAPFLAQFLVLSATYLVIDGLFLCAYGISAQWIATRFKGSAKIWIERAGGGFMIGAAVLLGLKSTA